MKFKQEDTQAAVEFIKTEDREALLPSVKRTQVSRDTTLSTKAVMDNGRAHGAKRTRYIMEAVVIVKRNPEVLLDNRYKDISSLMLSVKVKEETQYSEPAPAENRRRNKGKVAIQIPQVGTSQLVKAEPRDDLADVPPVGDYPVSMLQKVYSTQNVFKPAQESARQPSDCPVRTSPSTPPQIANRPMKVEAKIREESPGVASNSPAPTAPIADESIEEAMKKWKNPKAKVKKEAETLSGQSIHARLAEAGISMKLYPIDCPKAILDTSVSREFMSKIWGGSSQETFPRIGAAKFAEHGLRDFMYLPDNYQPIAPKVPGAPGIWIDENGDSGEWAWGVKRVFTRIWPTPALWMYQGQYEIKRARSMTKEEWQAQTPKVRNTWAREICRKGWGIGMRANIYQIKQTGTLPTMAERDDIINQKLYETIGIQEVAGALQLGEVTMALYTMKCIGYDKPFAKQVHDRWATYVPSARKPRGSGKREADNDAQPETSKARVTKKQKLEEDVIIVDDLSSGDGEEYDEDRPQSDIEMEDIEEVAYKPRGTKTRPRM